MALVKGWSVQTLIEEDGMRDVWIGASSNQ